MIQIDLLVAYSMSSGLALAAGKELATAPDPWVNRYSFATLAWLSLLFGPQVLYLLWQYPCWETMFVAGSHAAIPSWLAAGYPVAAAVCGLFGFYLTARLAREGRTSLARLQVAWSGLGAVFVSTVGWDGTGYRRMLYGGGCSDWAEGRVYSILEFLNTAVAHDMVWLQGVVVVPYAALIFRWLAADRRGR